MTQNEKDLLLKDLCARLPYGVKCKILETDEVKILGSIQYDGENTLFDFWEDDQKIQYGHQLYLSELKPCLFPLSSMTEEQKKELSDICNCTIHFTDWEIIFPNYENSNMCNWQKVADWLNKNMFDWRGLIPMGLAIDTTGLNIY